MGNCFDIPIHYEVEEKKDGDIWIKRNGKFWCILSTDGLKEIHYYVTGDNNYNFVLFYHYFPKRTCFFREGQNDLLPFFEEYCKQKNIPFKHI